jgi:hypothetical protein
MTATQRKIQSKNKQCKFHQANSNRKANVVR